MKTCSITPKNIHKKWMCVDAKDQPLGRLAARVAFTLQGKHKAYYVPHLDCGDCVVVINMDKIKMTGNKWKDKIYYRHSHYIGGIKAIKAEDLLDKHPERLFFHAVKGMLPRNKLSRKWLKSLRVYVGSEHPHQAQEPRVLTQYDVVKQEGIRL